MATPPAQQLLVVATTSTPLPSASNAASAPQPFLVVAAPTAIVKRSLIVPPTSAERYTTFHLFPFLPTEIRLKIWKLNLRPRILHVNYDLKVAGPKRYSYMHGYQHRAEWCFENDIQVANINTCQESRAEALKSGYEPVTLRSDVTQGRWFNFDIDSMFWYTNATTPTIYENHDDERYEPYYDQALPPTHLPVRGHIEKLKVLAVSDALWTDWPFSDDNGSRVSCEMCSGYHDDTTKEDWKELIGELLKGLEKLQIVRVQASPDDLQSATIKFKQSDDQYAASLKIGISNWAELSGLSIEVEVVELA